MPSEVITYETDGLSMISQLYRPAGVSGPRPGVLVFPEAFGLGEHALSRAERLAGLGYVALACDLHGGGAVITDMTKMMEIIGPLRADVSHIRRRTNAGLEMLKAQSGVDGSRIAAIGYCLGGSMALELACSGAPIVAAAGFHSGLDLVSVAEAGNIRGKVLVCLGADDPGITPEHRLAFEEGMRKGKVDWQMHLYGGVVHSFTNPAADAMGRPQFARYDAHADARSWTAVNTLFGEVFGG